MADIENLRKVQASKKSSMSMPLAVRVLEHHHERIKHLEALVLRTSISPDSHFEDTTATSDFTNDAHGFRSEMTDTEPDEHAAVAAIEIFPPVEEEVEELKPVEEPEEKQPEEKQPDNGAFLDELLQKLLQIQDEACLVEEELNSIKEAEAERVDDDDDTDSVMTECTDTCRELLRSEEGISEHAAKAECKSCIKLRVKMHKKEKKLREKERVRGIKAIKLKQKELLMQEQFEIAQRLKNIKSGRSEMFGMVDRGQIQALAEEIDHLAGEYAVNDKFYDTTV
jgi:hypothetical protein